MIQNRRSFEIGIRVHTRTLRNASQALDRPITKKIVRQNADQNRVKRQSVFGAQSIGIVLRTGYMRRSLVRDIQFGQTPELFNEGSVCQRKRPLRTSEPLPRARTIRWLSFVQRAGRLATRPNRRVPACRYRRSEVYLCSFLW